jgi:hypothetical protein
MRGDGHISKTDRSPLTCKKSALSWAFGGRDRGKAVESGVWCVDVGFQRLMGCVRGMGACPGTGWVLLLSWGLIGACSCRRILGGGTVRQLHAHHSCMHM